ncbi:MAG: ABC transporter permease [Candidatus Longimicrobiales bacterium M2_2A_002]
MRTGFGALLRSAMRGPIGRAALAGAGIAVSAFLVMTLLATYRSLVAGVSAYTGQEQVDLWVAPRGTDNLIRSSGLIDMASAERIRRTEGVARSGTLVRGFARVTAGADDRGITLLVLAYQAPGLGGPPRWDAGRPPRASDEIALDRVAAWRLDAALGDRVHVNGSAFRVVGLTAGTNLIATQLGFVDRSAVARLTGYTGAVSFVILEADDAPAVADRIERAGLDVDAFATRDFVRNNLDEVGAGFRPMQLMVSVIGLAAAMVIVMLLVQSLVADRKTDVAVLLAMGAPLHRVGGVIVGLVASLAGLGCLAGAGAVTAVAVVTTRWAPIVELSVRGPDLLGAILLLTGGAVAAAIVPLRRLRRIDPVAAFRP